MTLEELLAPDAPATISVEAAGELVGVSRCSAYLGVQRGEIPSLRIGRRIVVPVPALVRLLGAEEAD